MSTGAKQAFECGKAFAVGRAFAIGARYSRSLVQDARDRDGVIFRTTKSGSVLAIKNKRVVGGAGGALNGKTKDQVGEESTKKRYSGRSYPKESKDPAKETPSKSPDEYLKEAGGNYDRAITNFYDNELRNRYVETTVDDENGRPRAAKVVFDGKARKEFRKFRNNRAEILEVLPKVVDVISTGEYAGRRVEPDHWPQVAFHSYMKDVQTKDGIRSVAVDVGEDDRQGLHAYSVNREGISSFSIKARKLKARIGKRKQKIGRDSALLPPEGSVMNLHRTPESDRSPESRLTQDEETVKLRVLNIRILTPSYHRKEGVWG
jgi:hypothetical protein